MQTENQTVVAPAPVIAQEPTSDKLTELKGKRSELLAKLAGADENAALDISTEIYTIGQHMKAEIAAIKTAERNAEIELKRQERVAMITDLLSLHDVTVAVHAKKTSTVDEKNAAYDAEKAQFDKVANELLARYASSTPAKTATTPKDGAATTAGRGDTGARIKAKLIEQLTAGKSVTESVKLVVESGESRGTTGAVRTEMRKAGELSAYGENPLP